MGLQAREKSAIYKGLQPRAFCLMQLRYFFNTL